MKTGMSVHGQAQITVVIPVLNAADFLADSLQSVRNQQNCNFEIIVVDDGSTDGSLEIAYKFANRVLQSGGREGPSACRNLGVSVSTAEFIAFLDADDLWVPDHLSQSLAAFESHHNSSLIFSCVQAFAGDSYVSCPGKNVAQNVPFDAKYLLLQKNIVTQITVIVRRQDFALVGGYDEKIRLAEDYDLWQRLSMVGPFIYIPTVAAYYRVHPNQATANLAGLIAAGWERRFSHVERLRDSGLAFGITSIEMLCSTWAAEMRWVNRSGDRSLHESLNTTFSPRLRLIASSFGVDLIQSKWSSLVSCTFALRRALRRLI